jgi:hypothetical protein
MDSIEKKRKKFINSSKNTCSAGPNLFSSFATSISMLHSNSPLMTIRQTPPITVDESKEINSVLPKRNIFKSKVKESTSALKKMSIENHLFLKPHSLKKTRRRSKTYSGAEYSSAESENPFMGSKRCLN